MATVRRIFTAIIAVHAISGSAMAVDFALDVQPILKQHCIACHGPERQESNYRLDIRSRAFAAGDLGPAAIVKGSAETSLLYQAIAGQHEEGLLMPPDGEGKRLTAEEIKTLRKWIDGGAAWPDSLAGQEAATIESDHWSFQPVNLTTPPNRRSQLSQTPLDDFVFQQLQKANLTFSPLADRVTWLRRLYLDMHGLPPTQKQLTAFLNDKSPNAHERVIDEVLASHHYGERWARHWLDIVRFGESTGFEVNRDRENAYYYRDYVIRALNDDKSYQQFIVDQLAGDVAGDELGTGFLVGGPYDMVKSPDVNLTLMQRQDELADFVNTTATTFLAMTVGCARCHSHKFDPIPQRDYYAMQAVFAGVQHGERTLTGRSASDARTRIEELKARLSASTAALNRYEQIALAQGAEPETLQAPVNARVNTETFTPVRAQAIRFTITATNSAAPCIDELEVFKAETDTNVALASEGATASASSTIPGFDIHRLEHVNDGKVGNQHSWISATDGTGWIQIDLPAPSLVNRIRWGRDRNGQFSDRIPTGYYIEAKVGEDTWQQIASSSSRKAFQSGSKDFDFIVRLPKPERAQAKVVLKEHLKLAEQLRAAEASLPKAYIGTFVDPPAIHRLHRGDPLAPREVVPPGALSVLGNMELKSTTESARRLALASWIADPKNPLTARVIVNRVWQFHFGRGIVDTPSDFGRNGATPTHPELLDYLAFQLMQNDWSLKWLHREILRSHTYRQASRPHATGLRIDADTRLLWRFPPRRLSAEAIRDCTLHVSGALNLKQGGPGFSLFKIDHENVHHYFPLEEYGPEQFRRMVYMLKIRQEQDEVFGVFDCPDGGQVAPKRNRSTTPLQALNLLNSRFVIDQADRFADRLKSEAGGTNDKIGLAFQLAFSRAPTDTERTAAVELVDRFGLSALCRALFNTNEFLFLF